MARLWLSILAIWTCLAGAALAEPRIALVIGNGGYRAVNPLVNPVHDAALMAKTLTAAGFQVTLVQDADLATMGARVTEFGKALREAGVEATGLFYYAGHGVQSFGQNYLIPVDAQLTNAADLSLVALDAQAVLRQMASARNRTNIVILDACRNNPFVTVRNMTDNGLAEMAAPTGTFLAYATAPKAVALDGAGGNSPFTKALASEIARPGRPIEDVFKAVRVAVLAETGGQQTPSDWSSLTGDFTFTPAQPDSDEENLWANVSAARDPVQIMLFLRAYPDSVHQKAARSLLADVMQAEVSAPAKPTPAPVTGQPQSGAGPDEIAAFEAAQRDGTRPALQAFLTAWPQSAFAAAVTAEIAALDKPIVATRVPEAADPGDIAPDLAQSIAAAPVAFDAPLAQDDPAIRGKSIAELIGGEPLFAPIEGLPKEAWSGQHCTTCHKWTREALCDQAKVYVKEAAPSARIEQHPLGGAFKLTLKAWATGGCN